MVDQTPPRPTARRKTTPVHSSKGHRRGATAESFDSLGHSEAFDNEHGFDSPARWVVAAAAASGRLQSPLPPSQQQQQQQQLQMAPRTLQSQGTADGFMERESVERELSLATFRSTGSSAAASSSSSSLGNTNSHRDRSFSSASVDVDVDSKSGLLSFRPTGVERQLSTPDATPRTAAAFGIVNSNGDERHSTAGRKPSGTDPATTHTKRKSHKDRKDSQHDHGNSSYDSEGSGNTALSTPPKLTKKASSREYGEATAAFTMATTKNTADELLDAQGKRPNSRSQKRQQKQRRWAAVVVCLVVATAIAIGAATALSGSGGSSSNNNNNNISSTGTNNNNLPNTTPGIPPTQRPTQAPVVPPPPGTPVTLSPTIDMSFLAPNNDCVNAIGPLTINGPAVTGNNFNTTVSPTRACGQVVENGSGVWYHVTGGDEVIRASTCGTPTDFDTQLSIYQGDSSSSNACSNLQCVAGSDEFCGSQSSAAWFAAKGVNYYIYVHGWGTDQGNFALTVAYEENGSCLNSIGPIEVDGTVTVGSLRGGSFEKLFSCDGVVALNGIVWYSVYGTGSWMEASTCHEITEFGARVAVVSGGCSTIQCAAVRDSDCGNGYRAIWDSNPGELYHIIVFKDDNFDGSLIGLSVNEFQPVANDKCADPVLVQVGGALQRGSTLLATIDIDNAPSILCGAENLQPGVWFSVQGTGTTLLASTCNDATSFSTEIAIFGGDCEIQKCIMAEDQFCGEKASVYWDTVQGDTYYIFVHGSDYGLFDNIGDFGLTVEEFVAEENDVCESAVALDELGDRVMGSTFFATSDGLSRCNDIQSDAPGVWYSVQTTVGTVLRASTCNPETDFDTQISIFRGSCGSLTCIITDDNSCGFQSSVAWSAASDITYFIFVHGREKTSVGDFALTVEEYKPDVADDFCADAIDLSGNGSVVTGSTRTASFDNVGRCGVRNTGPGVWYSIEGSGTSLEASLCNEATNYDTAMSVFSGDCLNLDCVAGNRNGVSTTCGSKSELSWVSALNTRYYILVHGWDVRVGEFGLTVKELPSAVNNDFCVRAEMLSISSSVITGSTTDATVDTTPTCTGIDSVAPGVWYSVAGTGEKLIASTCNGQGRSDTDFDTRISVFRGGCGSLECVVGDDNGCSLQSRVIWTSKVDETYYIHIHGASNRSGNYGLVVDKFVPVQVNDFCAAAQGPLIPDGKLVTGSTVGSSFDNVGFCGTSNTGPGIWFFFVGTGERFTADTCNSRTNFDTKLSIFAGFDCNGLVCLDGVDDGCGLQSSISFDTELGETYWILLHGWGMNAAGNYGLTLSGSTFFG